jgi:hypothetical protein
MIFMLRLLLGGVRRQGHGPRAPDGPGELTLMPGAAPRDAAGRDLAALGHEVPEPTHVLVVDQIDLVDTELADLAPPEAASLLRLP